MQPAPSGHRSQAADRPDQYLDMFLLGINFECLLREPFNIASASSRSALPSRTSITGTEILLPCLSLLVRQDIVKPLKTFFITDHLNTSHKLIPKSR